MSDFSECEFEDSEIDYERWQRCWKHIIRELEDEFND